MGVISWIVFGLIVGLLARAIMPGRDSMGIIGTAILGILGGLLAGWLGYTLGWYAQSSGAGIIASVVGAIVVLLIYNAITRRKGPPGAKGINSRDRFAA